MLLCFVLSHACPPHSLVGMTSVKEDDDDDEDEDDDDDDDDDDDSTV